MKRDTILMDKAKKKKSRDCDCDLIRGAFALTAVVPVFCDSDARISETCRDGFPLDKKLFWSCPSPQDAVFLPPRNESLSLLAKAFSSFPGAQTLLLSGFSTRQTVWRAVLEGSSGSPSWSGLEKGRG